MRARWTSQYADASGRRGFRVLVAHFKPRLVGRGLNIDLRGAFHFNKWLSVSEKWNNHTRTTAHEGSGAYLVYSGQERQNFAEVHLRFQLSRQFHLLPS